MQLKYGCNPNQKPSRVFMENGDLPFEVVILTFWTRLTAGSL